MTYVRTHILYCYGHNNEIYFSFRNTTCLMLDALLFFPVQLELSGELHLSFDERYWTA